jgi:hypothetical protein
MVGLNHRLSVVERTISFWLRPSGLAGSARPSALPKERGHLLDGAATPPFPRRGILLSCGLAALCLGAAVFSFSQTPALPTELPQVRFNSGQNIVPYFEGWLRNPDGTFDLVFGYFNRNWKEEIALPAGPDNKVEPAGPDRGQPTYFLARRQRWLYRLRVPADFGNKEVTWTLTAHGRTEVAYGSLLPAQEITDRVVRSNGNLDPGEGDPNEPPSITLPRDQTASVSTPLKLTASVLDDGLPKPRPPRTPRPAATSGFGAQVNGNQAGPSRGLTVSWQQYGGPAKAMFEPGGAVPVTNGQAATAVRFSEPGIYRFRAIANDGAMSTAAEFVVTVK